jgi:hypothetical protein
MNEISGSAEEKCQIAVQETRGIRVIGRRGEEGNRQKGELLQEARQQVTISLNESKMVNNSFNVEGDSPPL